MFSWFKKKESVDAKPDRSMLVPRIKNHQFRMALLEMGMPLDQLPLIEPLVADLVVTYAFDHPVMFQMASANAIAEVGVNELDVRSLALANLKRQLPSIGFKQHGPLGQIVTGDNLEACTILADKFWNQIASQTEGEVVAAVPSRDVVLFGSSTSPDAIATLRALAAEIMPQAETHGLSESLIVWRGQVWCEF